MLLTIVFDAATVVDVSGLEHILYQAICILQSCDWQSSQRSVEVGLSQCVL